MTQKSPIRHLRTIAQLCPAISSTVGKKTFKDQYLLHTSSQYMASFGSLAAVWGTPANFNGFGELASLLQQCSDVAHWRPTKLCTMFGCLLGWYIICTFSGALAPDGILSCAKFTLRPSIAFSYIGSVTARHSTSEREPSCSCNCGTFAGAPPIFGWAAKTLGIGPHSSFLLFCRNL